jgi:hypothetical protein
MILRESRYEAQEVRRKNGGWRETTGIFIWRWWVGRAGHCGDPKGMRKS